MSEIEKPTTARQRLFVNDYMLHGNATRAAIAAGYSEKSAKGIDTSCCRSRRSRPRSRCGGR